MTIDLSWMCIPVCVTAFLGVVVVGMILSVRSRLRYANQIQDAMARGAFNDMNNPDQKRRLRWLGLIALIGLLGIISTLVILFLQLGGVIVVPTTVILLVFGIFGSFSVIAGILMQREINRRL